jgi:putative addiction module antidote
MTQAKVIRVGSETACILPEEVLKRLGVRAGEAVLITETQEGVMLTRESETLRRQLEVAEEGMREYRETLRELAK